MFQTWKYVCKNTNSLILNLDFLLGFLDVMFGLFYDGSVYLTHVSSISRRFISNRWPMMNMSVCGGNLSAKDFWKNFLRNMFSTPSFRFTRMRHCQSQFSVSKWFRNVILLLFLVKPLTTLRLTENLISRKGIKKKALMKFQSLEFLMSTFFGLMYLKGFFALDLYYTRRKETETLFQCIFSYLFTWQGLKN